MTLYTTRRNGPRLLPARFTYQAKLLVQLKQARNFKPRQIAAVLLQAPAPQSAEDVAHILESIGG